MIRDKLKCHTNWMWGKGYGIRISAIVG